MKILPSPIKVITDNIIGNLSAIQSEKYEDIKSSYSESIAELFEKLTNLNLNNSGPSLIRPSFLSSQNFEQTEQFGFKINSKEINLFNSVINIFSKPTNYYEIESKLKASYNSVGELFQNYSNYSEHYNSPISSSTLIVNNEINKNKNLKKSIYNSKTKLNYRPVDYRKGTRQKSKSHSGIINILKNLYRSRMRIP